MTKAVRKLLGMVVAASLFAGTIIPSTAFADAGTTVSNDEETIFVTRLTTPDQVGFNTKSVSDSDTQPPAPVPDLIDIFEGYDPFMYSGLPRDTRELQWGIETFSGSLMEYIPIEVYNLERFAGNNFLTLDFDIAGRYLNPNVDYTKTPVFLGFIDNDGEYHANVMSIFNQVPNDDNRYGILALNPDILKADDDSLIFADAYWERVFDSQIDYSGGTKTIVETKAWGINKTQSRSLASTIGVKVGAELGLSSVAKVTAEVSRSLTASMGYSISVDEREETQLRHTFGERFDDPYAYGIYHLVGEYRLSPSRAVERIAENILVSGVPELNTTYDTLYFKNIGRTVVGDQTFTYPSADYRAIEIYENGMRIPEQNLLDQYSFDDFTDSNWSRNNVEVSYTSEMTPEGNSAQKLTPIDVNGGIQQHADINSDGNEYTFGIWLKADEPHEAQIKVQNGNGSESEAEKVMVTRDWQYFSVTTSSPFSTNDGVTVVLWPGAYNGTTEHVYAYGAELLEE